MVIRPVSVELQKKAANELNETSARIEEDLQHIREWIKKQPHLKPRTDDQWLLSFLRGCKFSLQRAKEKLEYFYTVRTLAPEFFHNRDPFLAEIQEILQTGMMLPLPKLEDPASPRLLLIRWDVWDTNKVRYADFCKTCFMIFDVLMNEDDNCTIAGISMVGDLKGFSTNHLLQCTPALAKKAFCCIEKAYPMRTKHMECFNCPTVFDVFYNLIKSVISTKLGNRMNLYREQNIEKFYKVFPQKLLPREYGGDNGSVDELIASWKKKIESYREWFLDDEKFRTYEELRLGEPKTSADMFGVEGAFRKLAVD